MMFRALAFTTLVVGLSTPSATRAADTYHADPVHSVVVFRVKHMNTSYAWGRFNDLSGTFQLDPANPSRSALQFVVKAASVDTGNEKRDQHLKGPDFFNTVQYPTITFTSKTVTKSGNAYEVNGDLTLHGVTKPVSFRLTQTGASKAMNGVPIAGIETNFTIKQSDFGMTKMAMAIGDEVWINVSVEGMKK